MLWDTHYLLSVTTKPHTLNTRSDAQLVAGNPLYALQNLDKYGNCFFPISFHHFDGFVCKYIYIRMLNLIFFGFEQVISNDEINKLL